MTTDTDKQITWQFHFINIAKRHEGQYRCVANNTNDDFALSDSVMVEIQGKVFVRQLNHGSTTTSQPSNIGNCQTNRLTTENENPETGHYYSVDTIPLKNVTEETVGPRIAESNVLFITKITHGDIRQRWVGNVKSESRVNNRIHISTRGQKSSYAVVEEWNHFIRNVGYLPPHENIVNLLGFCRKMGIDYCLQEELCNGTVREYIEKHYGQDYLYGNSMEPIPSCFYRFGRDLICGVQFLHLHGWIHPGISVIKLLLNNTSTGCKLYDFCGLTVAEERIEKEIKKNGPIPFLSMAPEVFLQTVYTPKSDIWSVGVALWEIFSYGAWPPTHEDVSSVKDVVAKLMRPGNCSEILYATLTQCWEFNEEDRTTLSSLKTCLEVNIRDEWPKSTTNIEKKGLVL
ncbi:putative fibroblast growth factor receptor 4 isoform X3 [Apostichopus japonicus]|uniref:Putative fibroblast growth factor receptor 4 isoform X3 n=1 Tax=Stichopus japonicus TaxID=307972 RepID=A0A2G8JK16_STIJA|nr:putative fibroblast growth factor receptor 4 isoform X3 [Apostichopus japonicus]